MACTNAHIGRLQAIGIARESTPWTTSVNTKYRLPKDSGVLKPVVESVTDESGFWVIESAYDSQVVREMSELSIEGNVRDIAFGILLKLAFGTEASVAKSSPNGAVYDHTFTLLQSNNHPSATVWAYDPVGTNKALYMMLEELKVSANTGEYVKFSASMKGKKNASDSTPTVAYTTDNNFLARHVALYVDTTEWGLDSATALELNSFELTINKNLEMTGVWLEPDCILNQNFVVSGSFEAKFVNESDWLTLVKAATEKYFRIKILNSDVTIGSTANPELSFTFAKVVFSEWDKSSDNNAIVTQTVGFVANFNNTAGFSTKAKLTNTQSAVY